ncbi:hypothetical protein E2C01_036544 [Portunus trituberculatus]|uniref:Uncharacterized protein n=1 Tax=Portunus trituberculatus TaxID=210409 RepID=A0A5B7F6Z0_PORTR|nr:hypothetical protein [Portunus trituberculatus]
MMITKEEQTSECGSPCTVCNTARDRTAKAKARRRKCVSSCLTEQVTDTFSRGALPEPVFFRDHSTTTATTTTTTTTTCTSPHTPNECYRCCGTLAGPLLQVLEVMVVVVVVVVPAHTAQSPITLA